ncbi:MAG: discoidin domain-containing protein [Phycisphaerae bacterium]|nr:discoidin domain-containing protein [Phycisphaerae bacterium]
MCKRLLVLSLIFMAFASVQAAELVHRWNFNGDLKDSIGGADAVIDDIGANNVTVSESQATLAGGGKDTSDYIDLPDGILNGIGNTSITIECWATQLSVQNWSRIFDFGSTTTDNIFMSWTVATTLGNDRVEWVPNPGGQSVDGTNAPYDLGVEYHIALVIEPGLVSWYSAPAESDTLGEAKGSFSVAGALSDLSDTNNWMGRSQWGDNTANASYNEFRLWSGALTAAELQVNHVKGPDGVSPKGVAINPVPVNKETDVLRDVVLVWESGEYAGSHDVYLSTSEADVTDASRSNTLGIQLVQGQTVASLDVGRLEFGQTYYWRVDEVNATPDNTIIAGEVWSFDVEPLSYALAGDQIAVSASSTAKNSDVNDLINGSGLVNGQHSTSNLDMWLALAADFTPTLQFDFAKVQALDRVLIYNQNQTPEPSIGWGAKDIVMETSADGVEWTVVEGATQLTRAPGETDYASPDEISLTGVIAQHVRIKILNNWGGLPVGVGLSEVVFYAVPVYARQPMPVDGAVAVEPVTDLSWRQGRQAAQSSVALDVDEAGVAGGSAASVTAQGNTIAMTDLDVELSTTYFWRVDEVNDAEAVAVWSGDVWSFSTGAYVTVDDFESYSNFSPDRPFQTWVDGFGYSADEYFPVANPGNGSGAAVGHDIWSPSSIYFGGDLMEQTLTAEGSGQSMPIYYSGNSHADCILSPSQDWTVAGIKTLVLFVMGDRENAPGSLYLQINGAKITHEDAQLLTKGMWTQWNIDLASVGVAVNNVKNLNIGIESAGSGVIYVDEMRLYKAAPDVPVAVDPGSNGLAAKYSLDNNLNDTSGSGLGAGTIVGSAFYVDGLAGNGMGLSFNGTTDYATLPIGGVIASANSITIACWADFSNEGDAWQRIWDFGSGEGANPYMFLCPRVNTAGPVRFAIRSATVGESGLGSRNTLAKGWQHVAVVIDGDTRVMRLYINGSMVDEGTTGVIPSELGNTTQNYLAKSQYAADGLYQGAVDEVILYTRPLSEGEIRYLAGDN